MTLLLIKDFTFNEVWIGEDYIILGSGKLNVTPISPGDILVTLHNYSSAYMNFDLNESARVEIENGTFKVLNGETYLLYDNESAIIGNCQAANNAINFSIAAGQGYYIQAGTDNNDPPPSGGGGGGGIPAVRAFTKPQTVIENETMVDVIKELKLESKVFCRMDRKWNCVYGPARYRY